MSTRGSADIRAAAVVFQNSAHLQLAAVHPRAHTMEKRHSADFDGNGSVGATDLLALLVNWGPCP